MKKRIGIVTIGQSPRTDVVPEIQAHLGDHVEVLEHGALDGLSLTEVQELCSRAGHVAIGDPHAGRHGGDCRQRKVIAAPE